MISLPVIQKIDNFRNFKNLSKEKIKNVPTYLTKISIFLKNHGVSNFKVIKCGLPVISRANTYVSRDSHGEPPHSKTLEDLQLCAFGWHRALLTRRNANLVPGSILVQKRRQLFTEDISVFYSCDELIKWITFIHELH